MSGPSMVKGITLTDYFKQTAGDSLQESIQLECLIGDLITKPLQLKEVKKTIDQQQESEEDERLTNQQDQNIITQQYQEKMVNSVTSRNSRNNARDSKLSKLSSLELRSPSIKVYKSQKVRIRQLSNSPFQHQLKAKESFKTLYGVSPISSIQYHNFAIQTSRHHFQNIQKFYKNEVSASPREDKKLLNLRKIKEIKQFQRNQESSKKGKMQGLYNTMNAYTKKIRDQQRAKHNI